MTVKEYVDRGMEMLLSLYPRGEAKALLEIVLEGFCNYPAYTCYTDPDRFLPLEQLDELLGALNDLHRGRPIQYIFGKTLFESCIINVREGALIPRPETAELVRWARSVLEQQLRTNPSEEVNNTPLSVLDVCTGSGAIAVALAKSFPQSKVYGVDISEEALALAKENALLNNTEVQFWQADILHPCSQSLALDLMISNPPYVLTSEKETMRQNVLDYEPHIALFVPDDDPLLFYRALADWGMTLLKEGALLMAEINEKMGEEVTRLLRHKGYSAIEINKDVNGKPRMCRAVKRHTTT